MSSNGGLFAVINRILTETNVYRFIDKTQERVTGNVKLQLYKGSAKVVARESPFALYSADLSSFDSKTIDQKDAEGYCKYHGFQARMFRKIR